ncbi:ABC transporter substrate-binding protein [Herbiconiux moechotypicola]|uniref:Thiamine pyrimidine synthase n=1 Tax=Herbiconiux moechotypicola TaxID=637393 RepID=A0ABP5QF97_9MICO|nr:ABC transporter substrate-binding protein [Herbiconiux moechotypicola]MCS5729977.1 ABC transporter substrate-binding protein [Herbiconiux moechotypicola]
MRLTRTPVLALAAAAALSLTGCASAATSEPAGDDTLGSVTMQLGWIDNNQFAGEYMGLEQGYFEQAGLGEVTLTPGGSSATAAEAAVTSGSALLGIGDVFKTAAAIEQGGDLVVIGATYQKNPFALISMSSNPIDTPADLVGKTIALPDTDTLQWQEFLRANGIDESTVSTVPYTFDSSILTSGQVDGLLTYTTVGSSLLNSLGFQTQEFLLANNGLPLYGDPIVTTRTLLETHRAELKAFLTGTIEGWYWALAHPEEANSITNSVYAAEQNYDDASQMLAMNAQIPLIETPETAAAGILSLTPELTAANAALIQEAGLDVTAEQLFDGSLIAEIYAENPDLLG